MATVINLIIQLISGAAGSNLLASFVNKLNLGPVGNTIVGALGGAGAGQLLTALLGSGTAETAGAASGVDIGSLVSQIVGSGAGGAVLTAIVGLIRNSMAGGRMA